MTSRESEFRTLTEVGTLGRGKSKHRPRNDPDLYGGEYPFIQTGDVKHAPFYLTEYTQTYNAKGLAQSKLWPPGTLCITIAANIADTAILAIPACFPDSILGFTPHERKADVRYAKYCLDAFRGHMEQISKGTTQDNLSMDKLLKLRFWFPDYELQRRIASLLTAYDDLIANNQRRIALLESMAEEIYREWFSRKRANRARLRLIRFDEICAFEKGKNPTEIRTKPTEDSLPYLTADVLDGGAASEWVSITRNVVATPGEVMMLMDGSRSGSVFRGPAGVVASTAAVIRTAYENQGIVYHYLQQMQDAIKWNNTGSAIPHANKDFINRMLVPVPVEEAYLHAFNELHAPIYLQAQTLKQVSARLRQVRNTLLPRLISGKLRVDNLDIQFPPSMQPPPAKAAPRTARSR